MKRIILTAAILILSLNAAGQLIRVLGVNGSVYNASRNPVGAGVLVNLTAKSYNSTGGLNYSDSSTAFTSAPPSNNYYEFISPANTPSGYPSLRNTIGVASYLGYQVGVNISKYDAGVPALPTVWPPAPFRMDISMSFASNLTLDVGNDSWSPWEWEDTPDPFTNKEEQADLDPNKINTILRNNCQCRGCILNETTSECIIPLVFSSGTPGKITVDDIYIEYESTEVIDGVDYNKSFPISEGADWTIDVSLAAPYSAPIPQDYVGGDSQQYTPASCGRSPGIEQDAVDDAIWRLLDRIDSKDSIPHNCRLDNLALPDGGSTPFDPSKMFFRVSKSSVTPELWGPALVKLIVWI